MTVGALGEVVFSVSQDAIQTIRDLSLKNDASVSIHSLHLHGGKAEWTGYDPQQLTFKCRLSAYLGSDVETEKARLEKYIREGQQLVFTLGGKVIGQYRWILKSCQMTAEFFDRQGAVTQYDVSLTLVEYLR